MPTPPRRPTFSTIIASDMPRDIDWDALADDYRNAQTHEEREAAYQAIVVAYATDPDLPEYADPEAGADSFLRERGLTR